MFLDFDFQTKKYNFYFNFPANRIERECPNRRYVFERHPRKKLKLLASDHKEIQTANRTDCEERCLNEFTFVCRSVTYNTVERTCSMSRFTRRSHPELLHDDPNSDYLENTCLNGERRRKEQELTKNESFERKCTLVAAKKEFRFVLRRSKLGPLVLNFVQQK